MTELEDKIKRMVCKSFVLIAILATIHFLISYFPRMKSSEFLLQLVAAISIVSTFIH